MQRLGGMARPVWVSMTLMQRVCVCVCACVPTSLGSPLTDKEVLSACLLARSGLVYSLACLRVRVRACLLCRLEKLQAQGFQGYS